VSRKARIYINSTHVHTLELDQDLGADQNGNAVSFGEFLHVAVSLSGKGRVPWSDEAIIEAAPDLYAALDALIECGNIDCRIAPATWDAGVAALEKARRPFESRHSREDRL
jgi:hypothetical protein